MANTYGGELDRSGRLKNTQYLEKGDAIAVVTLRREKGQDGKWERSSWYEIRYGNIVDTKPLVAKYEDLMSFTYRNFTMDITAYNGDSGAPIFVFRNGKPLLIGIVYAIYCFDSKCYSYGTKLDLIVVRVFQSEGF